MSSPSPFESMVIDHGAWREHCLTLHDEAALPAVRAHLADAKATVVCQDVFRSGPPTQQFRLGASPDPWPVMRLRGINGGGTGLGGSQLVAVSGVPVEPLHLAGRCLGAVWEDDHARYCRLNDLRADDAHLSREDQARAVFDLMETALARVGLSFLQVVRTWFFNDRILEWYAAFNAVRTAFFRAQRVFDSLVPASTGIGMPNAAGTALVAGLVAVLPKTAAVTVAAVRSPLQCPALDYGSSFSRAVEIVTPVSRRLLVSGTASIAPGGQTVHVGDTTAQIDLTMRVVAAILASRDLAWDAVTRGVAYIRDAGDASLFTAWCRGHGVATLCLVGTEAFVCRDDLLFELEVDAGGPAVVDGL